jgi:hypothetical protein
MRHYYAVVLQNYVFRTEATGHIVVILVTYEPEAFPCFVALISADMLKTDIETDTLHSK